MSLTGAAGAALATANAQSSTSLLVSVPVTSTAQVNAIQAVPSAIPASNVLCSSTQTVVLTSAQSGSTGTMLSLPFGKILIRISYLSRRILIIYLFYSCLAQLVASGVKGLGQQQQQQLQRIGSTSLNNAAATGNIQLLGTIRPRSIPIAASPIGSKQQLQSRGGLVTTTQQQQQQQQQTQQRQIASSTMKVTSTPNSGKKKYHIIIRLDKQTDKGSLNVIQIILSASVEIKLKVQANDKIRYRTIQNVEHSHDVFILAFVL